MCFSPKSTQYQGWHQTKWEAIFCVFKPNSYGVILCKGEFNTYRNISHYMKTVKSHEAMWHVPPMKAAFFMLDMNCSPLKAWLISFSCRVRIQKRLL